MSRLLSAAQAADVQPISLGGLSSVAQSPTATGFRARFVDGQEMSTYTPRQQSDDHAPVDPLEQARADAFAQGFDAGVRITTENMEPDVETRERLIRALEQLGPANSGALASMLNQAVLRLVTQIVGNAPVDAELLRQRVERVAAFIEEEQGRNSLQVHPDDIALLDGCELGLTLTPNAGLSRGSIRLDTADGWIEDGPDTQLSRLKSMLDDMEGRP